MLIALHYCRKDQALAAKLAEWLTEIGPFPDHDLLVFRDRRADDAKFGWIAAKSVQEVMITDDVSNSWPASANHAMKKIAKHVQYSLGARPFLLLEPDCVILRGSAFDELEAEYKLARAAGKRFLGDLQDAKNNAVAALPGFVSHCSGISVYPGNLTEYAGEVFYAENTPWDIVAGPQIYPQATQSELILQSWNRDGKGLAPFASWADFEQKVLSRRPKCAVFHADKTGSLLGLLRERKNFSSFRCSALRRLKKSDVIRKGNRPEYADSSVGEELPEHELGQTVAASGYWGIMRPTKAPNEKLSRCDEAQPR